MVNAKTITGVLITLLFVAGVLYAFTSLRGGKGVLAPPLSSTPFAPDDKTQRNKKTCASVEISSVDVSREFYKEGIVFEPSPQITAKADGKKTLINIVAAGPALGSMDSSNVKTDVVCTPKGFKLVATVTRSAEYENASAKNVLWHPRIALAVVLHQPDVVFEATWKMVLSTGAELEDAQTLPYPPQNYPITVTTTLH